MSAIGKRIAKKREDLGLSQGQLARLVSVTRSAVSQLEAGTTKNPRPLQLIAYAKELGTTVDYLVTGRDPTIQAQQPVATYAAETQVAACEQELIDYLRRLAPQIADRERLIRRTLVFMQSLVVEPVSDARLSEKWSVRNQKAQPKK